MWDRLFERMVANPVAVVATLMLMALAIRELWQRLHKTTTKLEDSHEARHKALEVDMKATATALAAITLQQASCAKELGVLEQRQSQLTGKLDGLQAFWRSEFDKLREEWRTEFREMSRTLHDDLTAHRQVVHDRLDRATAAMAAQTTEFLAHLEDLLRGMKKD